MDEVIEAEIDVVAIVKELNDLITHLDDNSSFEARDKAIEILQQFLLLVLKGDM